MSVLVVEDLAFEVRRSPQRQSIQITVDRGGELILVAPEHYSVERMESFVRRKRMWVYTKLAEKEIRARPAYRREYVSGEGFPYLGRSYRLLLVDRQDMPLKLEQGRFRLLRATADAGRRHFVRWYSTHAGPWLQERVCQFAARLGVEPVEVRIRDLGFRWGSCSPQRRLNFHWSTILLPPAIAEYVVVHELVHIEEPHHGSNFWRCLDRAMPDWEARRVWLAERGADFSI